MPLLNQLITWFMQQRMNGVELMARYPHQMQEDWFKYLVNTARATEWGKKYGYDSIKTPRDFRNQVPVSHYDDLKPFIQRMQLGEQNILWPTTIKWFSKSSGTTADKSKFIPVSREALDQCHFRGGKDLLATYCSNHPNTRLFTGKAIGMTGTYNQNLVDAKTYSGDISAVLLQHLPFWVARMRTPHRSVALMGEWEGKIAQTVKITAHENITNITGVPSWSLFLLNRVLEHTGKSNIGEVWPNLELFVHGGVNFAPYREHFSSIAPAGLRYMDAYNASEGFFGFQTSDDNNDFLLLSNHGVYYEFLPLDELGRDHPNLLALDQVEAGVPYALVISTNAGLWRYIIGDTIRFTKLAPYFFRLVGRTRNFINIVGEELMIENADQAIEAACQQTKALITEYTAAPLYSGESGSAAHEWLIEFDVMPADLELFSQVLDSGLKSLNSDYEAKRYHDMLLRAPVICPLPKNTFYNWLKSKGKLGGQHKVPRLSNDRRYIDEILGQLPKDERIS